LRTATAYGVITMAVHGDYKTVVEFIYEEFRFDVVTSKLIRCGSTRKEFPGKDGVVPAMKIAGARSFCIPVFCNDPSQPVKALRLNSVKFCCGFSPLYPIGIWDMSNLITNPMRAAKKKFSVFDINLNLFLIEGVMCLAFESLTLHPTPKSLLDIESYERAPLTYASYVELVCQLFNVKDIRGRLLLMDSMEVISGQTGWLKTNPFEIRKQTEKGVERSVISYFSLERVAVGVEDGCVLKHRPNRSAWTSTTYLMDVEWINQSFDDRIGLTTEQLMESVTNRNLPDEFTVTNKSVPVLRVFKKAPSKEKEKEKSDD